MLYYLIIALQVFCIYHIIKSRNQYYWIFLILFLPAIGSIIYLITQVYNKRDANKIQEGLTSILVPSKKVKDLESQLQFSDTYQNRVNLADACFAMKDFKKAIENYQVALKDESQNNYYLIKQLIISYYNIDDYESAVSYSEKIKQHSEFNASDAQFIYGLSLDKLGKTEEAEKQLRQIDQRYSNYEERLVLAKFLFENDKVNDAKEILEELRTESKHMTTPNKRKYKTTIAEVEKLLQAI